MIIHLFAYGKNESNSSQYSEKTKGSDYIGVSRLYIASDWQTGF